jgi:hypothetical protein
MGTGAGLFILGGALVGGAVAVGRGIKERNRKSDEIEYQKDQTAVDEDILDTKWEQAKDEAADRAEEMEKLAEHMEESAAEQKELGLRGVGVGYEQLFGTQQQAWHQYGMQQRSAREAASRTAHHQGGSGLKGGSLDMAAEYQANLNEEQLDQMQSSIYLQRDVSTEQLDIQKEGILNAYDDALFKADQLEDEAQDLRDAYAPGSYNEQLYDLNKEKLDNATSFLEEQQGWYENNFWNIAGDALGGAAGGAQAGATLSQGLFNVTGWETFDLYKSPGGGNPRRNMPWFAP